MLGLSMKRAIFTAPLLNGLMTRVAPARSSLVTAVLVAGPGDNLNVRREHPGGQDDIHIVGVGRQDCG